MISTLVRVGIVVAAITGTLVPAFAGPGGGVDSIRAGLVDSAAEPWSGVSRWSIEYEAVPSATTEGIPAHRVMALANPGSFYHLSAHFQPLHPWHVDPFCQEYFISEGRTCHRWPFNRIYSEGRQKPGDDLGGTIEFDFLLAVLPHWPLADYKSPVSSASGTPIIPLEAMRSVEYRLVPERESISGEQCAVFDRKGLDRLWVATAKGVCVMRRDISNPTSRRLAQRIVADKVEQVAPRLWLPTEFRSQFFSAKRDVTEGAVVREYKVRILRCLLNDDVAMSLFTPVHRPGSLKFETATKFAQVSPGGEDLLSDIVDFMVSYANLPTSPFPRNRPYAWFLSGFVGGMCVGLVFLGARAKVGRQRSK